MATLELLRSIICGLGLSAVTDFPKNKETIGEWQHNHLKQDVACS